MSLALQLRATLAGDCVPITIVISEDLEHAIVKLLSERFRIKHLTVMG